MGNWLKATALAAVVILPGFGPISPDPIMSENAEHWLVAIALLVTVISVLVMWGNRKIDYKARDIAQRRAQIADQNKFIEALEDAAINAHVAKDEGHVAFLRVEMIGARANIARYQREIREIESGIDPDRRNVHDW